MLHSLALFTQDPALLAAIEQAAAGSGVALVKPQSPGETPAGAVAVLADAARAGEAVQGARRIAAVSQAIFDLLGRALDCRESIPLGSSWRVMEHAERFGLALGMTVDECAILTRAALLRDVGKILIPNAVLLKDGVLDYEEWTLIQRHPHLGADLLQAIPSCDAIAEAIRHHHECFDGDGYPGGLEGEDIPIQARVLRLLDVYCAFTSPRHYRKGHATHEEALTYLRSEQGKHFDPQLVEVFIKQDVGRPWPESPPPKKAKK